MAQENVEVKPAALYAMVVAELEEISKLTTIQPVKAFVIDRLVNLMSGFKLRIYGNSNDYRDKIFERLDPLWETIKSGNANCPPEIRFKIEDLYMHRYDDWRDPNVLAEVHAKILSWQDDAIKDSNSDS